VRVRARESKRERKKVREKRRETGAEASMGIAPKKGAKNSDRKNSMAAVTAVNPVRPPSTIPAVHTGKKNDDK